MPEPTTPVTERTPVKRKKRNGSGEITAADVAEIFEIPAERVLSFKDYGHSLTVVTTDGAKLTKALA